jgi:4-amino-4-deoxy-L-arabinose transferase-like glycosyltransferase
MSPGPELSPSRRLGLELVLVTIVSIAVLVPGIWSYSLVDPWETHYGEVAREMLQDHDLVHLSWVGGSNSPTENEGFRSKPVLQFWMMAATMKAFGLATDGGYSGEMVHDARTMIAIRLPIVLSAVLGLVLMWLMLAKLVDRKLAWLALLVVGSCPFFCLVSRQGIPDMPLCACVMGAMAMFTLAMEDGDRPVSVAFSIRYLIGRRFAIDHKQVVLAAAGLIVGIQAIYYTAYFAISPQVAIRNFPMPVLFFPVLMSLLFAGMWRSGWMIVRFVPVVVGSIIAMIVAAVKSRPVWPAVDNWDHYAPDRFVLRVITFPVAWAQGVGWYETDAIADHLLDMKPITTMRQVYLLWCYLFIGISILAKGPPGLGVVGLVGIAYVILFGRWRQLYDGAFEIKRGLMLMIVVFLPWHIGMWLKDGQRFIDEYLFTHILNRAAGDPDKSLGTFEYYTSQLGHGMWLWAALLPAALAVACLKARTDTRAGRVRFVMALWAICGFFFFAVVQTKFHHYILPIVPALGILVAFFLHDVLEHRERLHPIYALLGIGIVLLVCRDLMWEPDRWVEMFTFRYDRPWPSAEPYSIDPSDGFLGLGMLAAAAVALAAIFRRVGVAALAIAGLAICAWSLHVYMPIAGNHWGMRSAMRSYYEQRTIYGEKRVYFGPREALDELAGATDTFHFETFIPDRLQVGQPMTITLELNKAADEHVMENTVQLVGIATALGDHDVTVTLAADERAKLKAFVADCEHRVAREPGVGRFPIHFVDADRLLAWQLYWRGENFWSGDEIFAWAPEMKTGFEKSDNVDLLKYLNDRSRAPLGRRYFVITEASRGTSIRSLLPTQRGRDSFELVDTTSNKFSLGVFTL